MANKSFDVLNLSTKTMVRRYKRHKRGRKIFNGEKRQSVVAKLKRAYSEGATDEKACIYAEISLSALYRFQRKTPEFQYIKAQFRKYHFLPKELKILFYKNLLTDKDALAFKERLLNPEVLMDFKLTPIEIDLSQK